MATPGFMATGRGGMGVERTAIPGFDILIICVFRALRCSSHATLVVEAGTNITGGVWNPAQTLTPTNGPADFSTPSPMSSPGGCYGVRPQAK
jgi:hypothetical protein